MKKRYLCIMLIGLIGGGAIWMMGRSDISQNVSTTTDQAPDTAPPAARTSTPTSPTIPESAPTPTPQPTAVTPTTPPPSNIIAASSRPSPAAAQTSQPVKVTTPHQPAAVVAPPAAIAVNLPPTVAASLTDTNTYEANGIIYHALTLQAAATDTEEGPVTAPAAFSWRNMNADCNQTNGPLCQNEAAGANLQLDVPVVKTCSGLRAENLTYQYTFRATVRDTQGQTGSSDTSVQLAYTCTADPAALPVVTISQPTTGADYLWNLTSGSNRYYRVPFEATATDREDGVITASNRFTWQRTTSSAACGAAITDGIGVPCQSQYVGNDFVMNLTTLGCAPPPSYTFVAKVTDSDGNTTTSAPVSVYVRSSCGNINS